MGIRMMTNFEEEIAKTVKRIQELAEDGKPPTQPMYAENRGDCFYVDAFRERGVSWSRLIEMAGFEKRKVPFGDLEVEIAKAVKRLQKLSIDGFAPSDDEYERNRGDCRSMTAFHAHGVRYSDLVTRAGLEHNKRGVKRGTKRRLQTVAAELEEEIADNRRAEAAARRRTFEGLTVFPEPRRVWEVEGKIFVAWGVR